MCDDTYRRRRDHRSRRMDDDYKKSASLRTDNVSETISHGQAHDLGSIKS